MSEKVLIIFGISVAGTRLSYSIITCLGFVRLILE